MLCGRQYGKTVDISSQGMSEEGKGRDLRSNKRENGSETWMNWGSFYPSNAFYIVILFRYGRAG